MKYTPVGPRTARFSDRHRRLGGHRIRRRDDHHSWAQWLPVPDRGADFHGTCIDVPYDSVPPYRPGRWPHAPAVPTVHRTGREEDDLEVVAVSTVPWRRSRKRPPTVLELPCAERTVGMDAAPRLPNAMMLVIEDTCAEIARTDWQ